MCGGGTIRREETWRRPAVISKEQAAAGALVEMPKLGPLFFQLTKLSRKGRMGTHRNHMSHEGS